MSMETQTLPVDPILYDFELPMRAVYYAQGFPVEIATNSRQVLAGAEESWGHFPKVFPEPPLRLHVGVMEGIPGAGPPTPVWRGRCGLIALVADAGNFAVCDTTRGYVFCWLTQAAAENKAYLRYHFLEGTIWMLLEALYLTPLHAACVRLGNHGVLLCGDSGVGKSSLAFACARAGWAFLSDDSTCLVRARKSRVVVANPYQMRFRESAIELFPELKDQPITLHLNGEMAIELATARLPEITTTTECSIDYIVFLRRGEPDPPCLLRLSKDTAFQWFEQVICWGEREVGDAHRASLRNLLTAEVFELRYGGLDSAVKRLETMVHAGT